MRRNLTYYSLGERISEISAVVLGTVLGCGVFFELIETWRGYTTGNPEFSGLLLMQRIFVFGILGVLFVVFIIRGAWYHRFVLNGYILEGKTLHVYGPVFCRHQSIDLSSVRCVQLVLPFIETSNRRISGVSAYVRILKGQDGITIRLSIELPIWPAITACLEEAGVVLP